MQQRSWQDQHPQYPHLSCDSLGAHRGSHPAAERVEVDRAAEVSVASVISIHTDRYANATMGDVTVYRSPAIALAARFPMACTVSSRRNAEPDFRRGEVVPHRIARHWCWPSARGLALPRYVRASIAARWPRTLAGMRCNQRLIHGS